MTRSRLLLLALIVAVATSLVGVAALRASDARLAVDDDVSIGFARDMSVHHAQAVAMSRHVHRRGTDPDLAYMAFDIMTSQQGQIGIMHGWLELWQQPRSAPAGRSMAWMHGGHQGAMPGMATPEEVSALERLPVLRMEEQFLRLMIRHHRGAVAMADVAAERADSGNVRALAAKMSAGQQSEIEAMQAMLDRRGLAREPDHPSGHAAG